MTLANQLTVLRLLLAPVVVICIVYAEFWWAIAALLAAGLTDAVDGTIARRRREAGELGALLDPLADKILIVSAVVALSDPDLFEPIPAWVAILILGRDATILIVAAAYNLAVRRRQFPPSRLGKATTAVSVVGVLWILAMNALALDHPLTMALLAAMVTLTVLTSLQYLWRARSL